MKRDRQVVIAMMIAASAIGCSAILGLKDVSIDDSASDARAPDVRQDVAEDASTKDVFVPPSDATDTNDACKADTQNDALNCGYCGHDCLGATCSMGQCQAMMIHSDSNNYKGGLAVDQSSVYFTGFSTVSSMDKSGNGVSVLAQSNDTFFWGLNDVAITATDMYLPVSEVTSYFNDGGTLTYHGRFVRCPLSGCGVNHSQATSYYEATSPFGVTVDPKGIFFADYNNPMRRCNYPGCAGGPQVQNAASLVFGMASDGTNLYFSDYYGSSVRTCPLAGCGGGATIVGTVGTPYGLAVDATDIYVASYTSGTIEKIPKGGGGSTFASGQLKPIRVLVDGAWVYWTSQGTLDNQLHSKDGSVSRCPRSGCNTPEVLATGMDAPTAMAQDSTAIYWTSGDSQFGSQIWKIAK